MGKKGGDVGECGGMNVAGWVGRGGHEFVEGY